MHHQHLHWILESLRQVGLMANPKKYALGKRETQYLGFLVGQGGIKTITDKVAAIKQHPLPKTLKQLRSSLGFPNYYRHFIPKFSEKAAPLMELTKGHWKPSSMESKGP